MEKLVAVFEAIKGALVLLAGFGLLTLLHRDGQQLARNFVDRLHLAPTSHYAAIFLRLGNHISDRRLWFFAAISLMYAVLRFSEAYGLWKAKRWAEWLGVASGAIYLPVEIYELAVGMSWIKIIALSANAAIVTYLLVVIVKGKRAASR